MSPVDTRWYVSGLSPLTLSGHPDCKWGIFIWRQVREMLEQDRKDTLLYSCLSPVHRISVTPTHQDASTSVPKHLSLLAHNASVSTLSIALSGSYNPPHSEALWLGQRCLLGGMALTGNTCSSQQQQHRKLGDFPHRPPKSGIQNIQRD